MTSRRADEIPSYVSPHESRPAFGASYSSNQRASRSGVNFKALDKLHKWAHLADERLAEYGAPVKPYLPLIGRILVVVTFLEDTLRLVTGWTIQYKYLSIIHGVPQFVAKGFLLINIVAMLGGSISVILKKRLVWGVGSLVAVLVVQSFVYRTFSLQALARNVSLTGGLLLVLSDVFARKKLRIPGLPQADSRDRSQNFILVGRVLIVVLFISHLVRTKPSFGAILLNVLGSTACLLLVIGYKARISACLVAALLLFQNFVTNSYWKLNSWSSQRDSTRHEYFQTLSIIGGLILLVNIGAGKLSFDEKRKIY